MTDLESLERRLLAAENPSEIDDWDEQESYYTTHCKITAADVPLLVQIAQKWADPNWPPEVDSSFDEERYELLPVTAWRSLAELRSEDSVADLVQLLCDAGKDPNDDWTPAEMPVVFAKIGVSAIAPLARVAQDDSLPELPRMIAVDCLAEIVNENEAGRSEVVAIFTSLIQEPQRNPIFMNGVVVAHLADYQITEVAEAMERAFAASLVDVGFAGDWGAIREKLGVAGLGLEMPAAPFDSDLSTPPADDDEDEMSDQEEMTDQELSAYLDETAQSFAQSPEGQRVFDSTGNCGWIGCFLSFGVEQHGETVKTMTLGVVKDFLFDHAPRKISVHPNRAAEIIFELACFWEFQERELKHPKAASIVRYLTAPSIVPKFQQELAEPRNYGRAKSLVMSGMAAGYDMSSEEGFNQYTLARTQSLIEARRKQDRPWLDADSSSDEESDDHDQPIHILEIRVGRNDPCPCGSGKKYKKCCIS
ncbi:MAG: DUF1186 domain-containing protein [Pirellulaceae bacterium]|nr:DUF1186 domain-containing protein [Pirellulaceae bacterium]